MNSLARCARSLVKTICNLQRPPSLHAGFVGHIDDSPDVRVVQLRVVQEFLPEADRKPCDVEAQRSPPKKKPRVSHCILYPSFTPEVQSPNNLLWASRRVNELTLQTNALVCAFHADCSCINGCPTRKQQKSRAIFSVPFPFIVKSNLIGKVRLTSSWRHSVHHPQRNQQLP